MTEKLAGGYRVVPAGDAAALVVLGDEMSVEMSSRVLALARAVEECGQPGLQEVSPAYCTLLIHFDPERLSLPDIEGLAGKLLSAVANAEPVRGRIREIPTVYGGAYGPDLAEVASHHGMTEDEVVGLHSGALYTVCTLGFAPGQPYVVGLPSRLAMPRRQSPRPRVPLGAVTLANQTNAYPMPNPTGWWWIGRTSVHLFDPTADPPTYLSPGDRMKFIPVSQEEYLQLGGEPPEELQ